MRRRDFLTLAAASGAAMAGGNAMAQFTGAVMQDKYQTRAYWDDAYSNGAYIPNANSFYESWVRDAAAFRETAQGDLDISYGPSSRNTLDLFMPEGTPRGLAVFVHGGYWLETDKSMWSHLAAGAVASGWACAVPSYDLCPDVRIADITRQVARAIRLAAERVAGPIHISGHSAGGHLCMRMGCADQPLGADVTGRVRRILGISGLYDLRPLMMTGMNRGLRIDEAEAWTESPALLRPHAGIDIVSWVGGDERPEFIRQSELLATIWAGVGAPPEFVNDKGFHHFDVIAGLSEPDSPITTKWLA